MAHDVGRFKTPLILSAAAAAGLVAGGATSWTKQPQARAAVTGAASIDPTLPSVAQCYAVDGDTLRCGSERIRLIGIDSPEMPGHCAEGRRCVGGDPFVAKAALSGAVASSMKIRRFGTDHYGRTLALVQGPFGDLSCSQLHSGNAIYRADWDVDGAMIKGCG
jgi:endonuclease YncB( thermonuclease family)